MGIGLGLLPLLTVSQLRAVLAHEFGHYYGGDTRLGPLIYRTREALGRTIVGLARHSNLLQKPFLWYGELFLRVTHAISRRQELVADELAARIAGVPALMNGLRATHGGALAYQAYWATEVMPLLNNGYRPPLTDGFTHFIAQASVVDAVTSSVQRELAEGESDPFDTHPPLRERLAAAERLPSAPPPADDPPALSLLADVPGLEMDLLLALGNAQEIHSLRPVAWDHAGAQVYLPMWEGLLGKYAHLLTGITPITLPAAARSLAQLGRRLVEPDEGQVEAEELERRAVTVLGAALAVALARQGWTVDAAPGAPVICRRGDDAIQPFAVVEQLAAGELDAAAWQAQSAAAGITTVEFSRLGNVALAKPKPGAPAR